MRAISPLLLLKPTTVDLKEDWEKDLIEQLKEESEESTFSGGDVTVRYISGRIDGKVRSRGTFAFEDRPFPRPILERLTASIPHVAKMEPIPRGFNEHAISMLLSTAGVMGVLGLFCGLVGLCIFLIGIALPFGVV